MSHAKKTKLNTVQNNPKYESYIVSLHYTSDENREIMEELAILLKMVGFDILGIDKVDYQYRDILILRFWIKFQLSSIDLSGISAYPTMSS